MSASRPHHDPRLHDDRTRAVLPIDATQWHTYATEWTDGRIDFYIDDHPVHSVSHRIAYPMQSMLDLFEFPPDGERDPLAYPKTGLVRSVRGYRS